MLTGPGGRGVEQRLELDPVQSPPALDRRAADRALPRLGVREQQRPREQRQRVRDQPRVGLQQAAARVERRLEDLLLERLVADDLRDEQVGRLGQLDLAATSPGRA